MAAQTFREKKKQSRAFGLVTGMVSSISSVFLRTGDALKISSC